MTSCLQHTIHYGGHSSRTHKVRLELNNLVCFNLVGAAAGWFLLHQDDLNCSKTTGTLQICLCCHSGNTTCNWCCTQMRKALIIWTDHLNQHRFKYFFFHGCSLRLSWDVYCFNNIWTLTVSEKCQIIWLYYKQTISALYEDTATANFQESSCLSMASLINWCGFLCSTTMHI